MVDALYGAGLSKPLSGDAAKAVDTATALRLPVVAVDLPSGVSGASGEILGKALRAEVTVTFARKKPGHLLLPGRERCGEIVLADIGIGDGTIAQLTVSTFENVPDLWLRGFPVPAVDAHKYKRGHVGVFSGGPSATGAARLSALAAARSGAGAVTVLSPANAMQVNAAHLTSIMLRKADDSVDVDAFIGERRPSAFVLGPGFGVGEKTRKFALALLTSGEQRDTSTRIDGLVFDADAITSFREAPDVLFQASRQPNAPALVITPHEGEFARLFPDIAGDIASSKLDKARTAAARANTTIVYKGADTVIAAPNGLAVINSNGAPWLATAGSGDVCPASSPGRLRKACRHSSGLRRGCGSMPRPAAGSGRGWSPRICRWRWCRCCANLSKRVRALYEPRLGSAARHLLAVFAASVARAEGPVTIVDDRQCSRCSMPRGTASPVFLARQARAI